MMCFFWIFIGISVINGDIYIKCNDIKPGIKGGHLIICDNKCNDCNIECFGTNCMNSEIYSSALNTNINCNDMSSCKGVRFRIGYDYDGYPYNLNENNFIRDTYNSVILNCNDHTACINSNIYIRGSFINSIYINANGNGFDIVKNAVISIQILTDQYAMLNCGGLNDNRACINVDYTCYYGKCICIGNNCQQLSRATNIAYQSSMPPSKIPSKTPTKYLSSSPTITTLSPTKLTQIPTILPTNEPSNNPSVSPTINPTVITTKTPSNIPTTSPSHSPTNEPTMKTSNPSFEPTLYIKSPSITPTFKPIITPSTSISITIPTILPTLTPTQSLINKSNIIPSSKFNIQLLIYIFGTIAVIIICLICIIIGIRCHISNNIELQNKEHSRMVIGVDSIPREAATPQETPVGRASINNINNMDILDFDANNSSPEAIKLTPGYMEGSKSESSRILSNNKTCDGFKNTINDEIYSNNSNNNSCINELSILDNDDDLQTIEIVFDNTNDNNIEGFGINYVE